MHVSKLSGARQAALKKLEEAEDALKALGFCIFRQAAYYASEESAHFSTRLSVPYEKDDPMFDHSFADAMRDLSMHWSNAAHGSQVIWAADTGHEAKEHSNVAYIPEVGDRVSLMLVGTLRFGTVEAVTEDARVCDVSLDSSRDDGYASDYLDAVAYGLLTKLSTNKLSLPFVFAG